jgi:hypothetical protein
VVIPRHAPAPKQGTNEKPTTAGQQNLTAEQISSLFSTYDGDLDDSPADVGSPQRKPAGTSAMGSQHSKGSEAEMVSSSGSVAQ